MDQGGESVVQDKLEAALCAASREQLHDAIRKRAEWDDGFRAEVLMRLGAPDLREALDAVKERIRIAIRRNTKQGFIDYRGCNAICLEMEDCLDTIESLYAERSPAIAFELALYVLIAGIKLASGADSSSGSLVEVIGQAMELLEDICRKLAASEDTAAQKRCYERLCKEALGKALDGWSDWSYGILEIAALLVTRRNVSQLDAALGVLRQREAQKKYASSSYTRHEEAMVRLKAIEILEGGQAARAFIDEHLDIDEMRMLAVRQDMEAGAYQNAERLCLERADRKIRLYGGEDAWRHLLFDIYAATGETGKQIEVADALVCRGELQYYLRMKALYGEAWSGVYPAIRARYQVALPRHMLMHILHAEGEWRLLLEEVRKEPAAVFQYGKALAASAPDEIYRTYREEIVSMAASAAERRAYQSVCASIRELSAAGGTGQALALIDELAEAHKRRPAMLDELAACRRRLAKQPGAGPAKE